MTALANRRDLYCGAVLALIGAIAVNEGRHHHIGSLTEMQAGYFPIVLGTILIALGLLIAATSFRRQPADAESTAEEFRMPDWRGCSAIILGVLAFIVLGGYFGLAPATFFCVFISALGDRNASWRGAFVLAAALTAVAIGLFAYLLQIQFPILQWPNG
jgi:heme A synthase